MAELGEAEGKGKHLYFGNFSGILSLLFEQEAPHFPFALGPHIIASPIWEVRTTSHPSPEIPLLILTGALILLK